MTIREILKYDKPIKESTVRQLLFGICIGLYFFTNLIFFINHEPYRDEANVWLMAKYLSPVELLREIHYQGHPCLWYLLVMPFAKLGLPYRTIEVLSFLIMLIAAVLFVGQAKLIGIAKIACLFSPIFLYFYPVIARGYCLIVLLLVLVAIVYPKRFHKPVWYGLLLGLLVQADTISVGLAGGLSVAWLTESLFQSYVTKKNRSSFRKALMGLWIPLTSFFFWIFQMAAEVGQIGGDHGSFSKDSFFADCRGYAYHMVERLTGWTTGFTLWFFIVLLATGLILCVYSRNVTGLFVFLFSYAYMSIFSIVVYGLHIWHFISLAFSFFWMVWMMQIDVDKRLEKEKSSTSSLQKWLIICARYVLNGLVVLFAVCCFLHWNSEDEPSNLQEALHGVYSNAGEAAAFLQKNVPRDALIVSTNAAFDSSVLAFLDGYEMHFATNGMLVNHAIYAGEELKSATLADIEGWISKQYPDIVNYYVIVSDSAQLAGDEIRTMGILLYESQMDSNRKENYRIYEVKKER